MCEVRDGDTVKSVPLNADDVFTAPTDERLEVVPESVVEVRKLVEDDVLDVRLAADEVTVVV